MRRFLIAASAAAAIAVACPVWAQQATTNPPPSGANTPAPVQSLNRMPAGGRATSERGATGSVTRAHHRRHAVQSASRSSSDNSANQLNQQELSQIQGANPTAQDTNPTTINRMPAGGRATSGGPHF